MIQAEDFIHVCKKLNYTFFTGTPCSYLKPFINFVIDDQELGFVAATNEGDAVAIASGASLAGKKAVVMFQNSGLGNAVNPLTSLNYIFKIPFLGIVTLRGEPGGPKDEPQHLLMGSITTELLDLMKVGWSYFPQEKKDIEVVMKTAEEFMQVKKLPYFLVMKDSSVNDYQLKVKAEKKQLKSRTEALQVIQEVFHQDALLLATTGKCGRELFSLNDKADQFYMVGSMGCILSLGLGLAKATPKKKVIVIDGDGSLMMRMGSMCTAGIINPSNLIHLLLDNGVHDSTGGQLSHSQKIDFCAIARACGYKNVFETNDLTDLKQPLPSQLTFIRININPGSPKELLRPTVTPQEVAIRFSAFCKKN